MQNDKFYYQGEEHFLKSCNYLAILYLNEQGNMFLRPHEGYFAWDDYPETPEDANKAFHAHFALLKDMGFNSIRLMYNAIEPSWAEDKLCMRIRFDNDANLPVPMLTAREKGEFGFRDFEKLYNLEDGATQEIINGMHNLLDIALLYDLKVIWVTGRGTKYFSDPNVAIYRSILQSLNHTLTNQYIEYLTEISNSFKDHPALFAFDLLHELRAFKNEKANYLEDNEKVELSEVIKEINNAVKINAPNHYTTVGFVNSRQFTQLGVKPFYHVDFYNFHLYDEEKSLETNNPGDYINMEMYYFNRTIIDKPWMIGEIGIETDPDNHEEPFYVNEIEQREFAFSTIEQSLNCSSLGYAWWEYKDHLNYQSYGLLRNVNLYIPISIQIQENPYNVHGAYKSIVDPALGSVFNIEMSSNECTFDNDLYRDIFSTPSSGNNTFTGTVMDGLGNPVEDAMVSFEGEGNVSGVKYPRYRYTFTNENGEYAISFSDNGNFPAVAATKYGYSTDVKTNVGTSNKNFIIDKINYPTPYQYSTNIIVNSNETVHLDFKRFVLGNIIIEDGGTLIISDSIFFNEHSKIIVKPGAKLFLQDGAVLTAINHSWIGVVLQGDQNLNSKPEFITNGNNTISKAFQAINSHFGTKISMTGTKFLNNYEDVFINRNENNSITFTNCDFVITSDALVQFSVSTSTDEFVRLRHIDKVKFVNCNFYDYRETSEYAPYKIGISAHNVKNIEVLPALMASDIHKSSFNNLKYGIKAITSTASSINVVKADFNTSRGIYLHGYMGHNNIRLINNIFSIKDYNTTIEIIITDGKNTYKIKEPIPPGHPDHPGEDHTRAYGIYIDNRAVNYHIEGNTFTADNNNKNNRFGIVVKENRGEINPLYRNTFNNLENAVQAIGMNRSFSQSTHTGVEILCNNFTDIGTDIFVTNDINATIPNYGIAPLQGNINNPAGNLFSTDFQIANINNELANFSYFHRNLNDPNFNLREVPEEILGEVFISQIGQNFNESLCPDNTPQRPFPTVYDLAVSVIMLEASMFANNAAESLVNTSLNLLVDGGNTNLIVNSIIKTNVFTAWFNYLNLMLLSPFLSDEVLLELAKKETGFSHAMIRDIMVANPQSAKNKDVMRALQNRNNALPSYMIQQIEGGLSILGQKEKLEFERTQYRKNYDKHLFELIEIYNIYSDSLPNADIKIVDLLNLRTQPEYLLMLSEHYAAKNDFTMANNSLNRILTECDIPRHERNEYANLQNYYSFYSSLISNQNFDLFDLDSITIAELNQFESYGGLAGGKARAILLMNNASSYIEPIYLPIPSMTPKKQVVSIPVENNYSFAIYPNPANNYINIEYNYEDNEGDLGFAIIDNLGRIIYRTNLQNKQDVVLYDTEHLTEGLYYCIIYAGSKRLFNTKIIIQR